MTIELTASPSFRDIKGRFVKADEDLLQSKREMMRNLGRLWQTDMREEAQKNTGDFAKGIRYRTYQNGSNITLIGYMPQPLGTFITKGTKPHKIFPRNANALAFTLKNGQQVVVPKGGGFKSHYRNGVLFSGKGYVDHPGTKPNPFDERVMSKLRPFMRRELSRITVNYMETVTG